MFVLTYSQPRSASEENVPCAMVEIELEDKSLCIVTLCNLGTREHFLVLTLIKA